MKGNCFIAKSIHAEHPGSEETPIVPNVALFGPTAEAPAPAPFRASAHMPGGAHHHLPANRRWMVTARQPVPLYNQSSRIGDEYRGTHGIENPGPAGFFSLCSP